MCKIETGDYVYFISDNKGKFTWGIVGSDNKIVKLINGERYNISDVGIDKICKSNKMDISLKPLEEIRYVVVPEKKLEAK